MKFIVIINYKVYNSKNILTRDGAITLSIDMGYEGYFNFNSANDGIWLSQNETNRVSKYDYGRFKNVIEKLHPNLFKVELKETDKSIYGRKRHKREERSIWKFIAKFENGDTMTGDWLDCGRLAN